MSKQVLISLLRRGNNGAEILSILDVIAADAVSDQSVSDSTGFATPTLEEIDF